MDFWITENLKGKSMPVMIDIETMATTSDAAIVSIGTLAFEYAQTDFKNNRSFYIELDWRSQKRRISPDTVEWWRGQSKEARNGLRGTCNLKEGLKKLANAHDWEHTEVWANGPTFDIGILEHAMRNEGVSVPWKFFLLRDVRTIKAMYEKRRSGISERLAFNNSHNALEDCFVQTEAVCNMYRALMRG